MPLAVGRSVSVAQSTNVEPTGRERAGRLNGTVAGNEPPGAGTDWAKGAGVAIGLEISLFKGSLVAGFDGDQNLYRSWPIALMGEPGTTANRLSEVAM